MTEKQLQKTANSISVKEERLIAERDGIKRAADNLSETEKRDTTAARVQELRKHSIGIIPSLATILDDSRFLLPFVRNGKVGLLNHDLSVIVKPFFDEVGDCYGPDDVFPVGQWLDGRMEHKKWGVMDASGWLVLPMEYSSVRVYLEERVIVTRRLDNDRNAMVDFKGNIIVEEGQYVMWWGFKNGLMRVFKVQGHKRKFGILRADGTEFVPCIYDDIWDFTDKEDIVLVKDGKKDHLPFPEW